MTTKATAHFAKTLAAPIAFLCRRLSPKGYMGLHLTLGMLVLIAGCAIFGELTEDVVTHDPSLRVDETVTRFFHERATPGMTTLMKGISFVGSGDFLAPVATLLGVYLGWRRRWHRLLMLVLAVGGGTLLNLAAKQAIQRHRPVLENPIVTLDSYSFPSGHAMAATLFYGLLAVFAVIYLRRWAAKLLVIHLTILVILLVGFSRIYLGAHYLSDVLGAIAAGAAWLALIVTAVASYRSRKEHRARRRLSPHSRS
ncbi:MAG: hypothetical protein JWM88_618 [Verrucomicrobia bacterium]|nr:hypothetical protein [Verrucomicrobiota bacterium]